VEQLEHSKFAKSAVQAIITSQHMQFPLKIIWCPSPDGESFVGSFTWCKHCPNAFADLYYVILRKNFAKKTSLSSPIFADFHASVSCGRQNFLLDVVGFGKKFGSKSLLL